MREGKIAFNTRKATELGGPYSQSIIYDGLIYLSGQGPIDPVTNKVVLGTIENETRMTMTNIKHSWCSRFFNGENAEG